MNRRFPRCVCRARALTFVLAALQRAQRSGYQGWIEADLIFVAPDEVGRVQTLSVREGDAVKAGDPLFTVDDDLQRADLAQVKATLTNAQQTFDRARSCSRPAPARRRISTPRNAACATRRRG